MCMHACIAFLCRDSCTIFTCAIIFHHSDLKVSCDKCWSLAQCTRMKHTLDPHVIAFLDMDDAPGVTPAKRSCKHISPSGSAKVVNTTRWDKYSTETTSRPGLETMCT